MKYAPITVAPDLGAALARLDGATMRTTEYVTDHLLPELEVRWDETTTITVPTRMRALVCPECDGAHLAGHPDALQLDHAAACDLGEEEAALLAADLRRLVRHGSPRFHRPMTEGEQDLLGQVGLSPRTPFVGVHAEPGVRRRRTLATLSRHEPALTATTEEIAR